MIIKLAWRNVKKSYRDFTLYFMTLTFAICMFYSFHTFQEQQVVFDMTHLESELLTQINTIMSLLSILVMIVLIFLILYATIFLIQRRKKELAIYMIEGMETRSISNLLILETFFIGLGSLIAGLLLGLLCSQLLTLLTGHLFEMPMEHYSFIISPSSIFWTISCFCLIFIIVMFVNIVILHRYQLIDLLKAESKLTNIKKRPFALSIFVLLCSISLLGVAYHNALSTPLLMMSTSDLKLMIVTGIAGTILLFYSLSGFLLYLIQHSKRLYYRNLNLFSLQLLYNHMSKNFISISMVCFMLLMGIGALATGFSLRNDLNEQIHMQSPFDLTISSGNSSLTAKECVDQIYGNSDTFAQIALPLDVVTTQQTDMTILQDLLKAQNVYSEYEGNLFMVKQSQVQALLEAQDIQVSFDPNQISILTSHEQTYDELSNLNNQTVELLDHTFEIQQVLYAGIRNSTTNRQIFTIVPDSLIDPLITAFYQDNEASSQFYVASLLQANFKQSADPTMFDIGLQAHIQEVNAKLPDDAPYATFTVLTREMIKIDHLSLTAIFTYAGIYLGFIFLISAGVLLGIQQLNAQSESSREYQILSNIGASKIMLHHTMLLQISLYFIAPLSLALLHAMVGIQVVNQVTEFIREVDVIRSSLFVTALLVLIYGGYYLITYLGCKRTIS